MQFSDRGVGSCGSRCCTDLSPSWDREGTLSIVLGPAALLLRCTQECWGGQECRSPGWQEQGSSSSVGPFLSACPSFLFAQYSVVNGRNCAAQCVFFLRYPETNCKDKIRRDLKAVCCTGCASQPGSVGHGEVLQLYYGGWVSFAFKIQLLEEIKNELEVMNLTFEVSHLQGKNTWEKIRRFLIFFFLRTCRLQVFPLLLDEFCSCTIQTENYHRGLWSECSSAVLPGDWQQLILKEKRATNKWIVYKIFFKQK